MKEHSETRFEGWVRVFFILGLVSECLSLSIWALNACSFSHYSAE